MSSLFINPFIRPLGTTGEILPLGKLYFYDSGTLNEAPVYDDDGDEYDQPVLADITGLFPNVYMDDDTDYRVRLENAAGVEQGDVDPWTGLQASGIGFIQAGAGAVQRTAQAKAREIVSVTDFGAVGDGVTDDYAAIQAAINAVGIEGGRVFFPMTATNVYYISDTLNVRKMVHLLGCVSQAGVASIHGTQIKVAAGKDGIVINSATTSLRTTVAADPLFPGAYGSVIENIMFLGQGGATSDGVVLRTQAECRKVTARGFSRDGFHIYATLGGGGAIEGDANQFMLTNCKAIGNGRHGLYTDGNDANRGKVSRFFGQNNGEYAVYENSILGNTYDDLDFSGNGTGTVYHDRASASNTFTGMWEDGSDEAIINYPATVIGGNCARMTATSTGFSMAGGLAQHAGYAHLNSQGSEPVQAKMGGTATDLTGVFSFGAVTTESSGEAWKWNFDATNKGWRWEFGGSTSFRPIEMHGSAAAIYTNKGLTGPIFQNGYGVKNSGTAESGAKVRLLGAAAPVAGTFEQGDIVYNSAPAAAGTIGWVCTAGGTPGTWKTFGTIAP